VPRIAQFDGMTIYMYYHDNQQHHKSHVHVFYSGMEMEIGLDGEVLAGVTLPNKKLRATRKWLTANQGMLDTLWEYCMNA